MIVTAIRCPQCESVLYSRAGHDFRSCPCGTVSVDGGPELERILWHSDRTEPPKSFPFKVEGVTKGDLYDDWNHNRNKYGLVPGPSALQKLARELKRQKDEQPR